MQSIKNRCFSKIFALALILIISVTSIMTVLPSVLAHDPPWTIPTYAYISLTPTTVGVGQYVGVFMWLDKYPPTAGGLGGDLWRGFVVDVTKPDGSKEQLGPFTSSTIAGAFTQYTPTQIGEYTFVFSWPGQTLTNGTGRPNNTGLPFVGDYFEGATSDPAILTVQEDPVAVWEEPPLPDYWDRPINTANREWAQLASNWPGGSWLRYAEWQEQGTAPNSAHILYAREIIEGGIADERYGAVRLDLVDYESFFSDPIVMMGKIYFNAGTHPNYGYSCVDLKTGELLWHKNGTDNGLGNPMTMWRMGGGGASFWPTGHGYPQLEMGQVFYYYSLNGEGVKSYLWAESPNDPEDRWYMIDPNTGNWILTFKNVPGGTMITDQDGSILLISYSDSTGRVLGWNVTQAIGPAGPVGTEEQQWEPMVGRTIDAVNNTIWTELGPDPDNTRTGWLEDDIRPRTGHTMNFTIPAGLRGSGGERVFRILQDEDRVPRTFIWAHFPGFTRLPGGDSGDSFRVAVVNISDDGPMSPFPDKPASQNWDLGYSGQLVMNKVIPYAKGGNLSWHLGPISYEERIFTLFVKETREWYGYSLDTGSLLWGPTAPQPNWDMYGRGSTGRDALLADGKLYSGCFGGVLHCYDITTGELLWTYTAENVGYESPYGNYPIGYGGGLKAADGKIFVYSSEHSPTQPLWRGSRLRAIDAENGTELWTSLIFCSDIAIADGCIVAGNYYDNRMYVYGKGPSATTISIRNDVITEGESIMITGSVTDQSPGAKGTPAIRDEDMDRWMDYLYMQQSKPEDAMGVTVKLSAYDPNGNYQDIGTTTVDLDGNFGKLWTPPVPGEYYIRAEFEGSESYGSSSATTYIGVAEAPQATPPPDPTPAPMTDTYVLGMGAVAIVVIIIFGILILLMLRKR